MHKYELPESTDSDGENDPDNDSQEETFENFFRKQRARQKKMERITARNVEKILMAGDQEVDLDMIKEKAMSAATEIMQV